MIRHRIYPKQTILQHRDGYIYVKRTDGKWIGQGRDVMQKAEGRELESHEYVFHKDGDRANNEINNLVIIARSKIRYSFARPKVLYMPSPAELTKAAAREFTNGSRKRELVGAA